MLCICLFFYWFQAEYAYMRYAHKKTCNYNLIPILYDKKKKEITRSLIFWRKDLYLQGNQVFRQTKLNFWWVLSQREIIKCISFFVDKQYLAEKCLPTIFNILYRSWEDLKNNNIWFLQSYKFFFTDLPKISNNFQNRQHVF